MPRPEGRGSAWFTGVPRPCRSHDRPTEKPAATRIIPREARGPHPLHEASRTSCASLRAARTEEDHLDIAAPPSLPPSLPPRARLTDGRRTGADAGNLAAVVTSLVAALVYVRTLLQGVSVGDWAESQMIPSRLGILHPTGYPLYTLLGKLFSMIPIGSVAYRADLLSAVAAAGVVGVTVLIAVRLGVRPVIAAGAALCLAFTGTLWEEATFSEMNGLHVLLVALLVHRALVWRAERRQRDLVIGALLAGLTVSNHGLAITVVPLVILFVLLDARREIASSPVMLVRAAGAFVLGLLPYLYLPLRALAGPREIYAPFLTWNGFFAYVSGAQFRGDMHFLSGDSVRVAWAAMPQVIDHLVATSNVAFVVIGVVGLALLLVRDRWFGSLLVVLAFVNVYIYANYLGDLSHYLLTTWLILAVGLAIAADRAVSLAARATGSPGSAIQYGIVALPLLLLASNWTAHDQSTNQGGERLTAEIFAALPPNAVLVTYWDVLTALSYKHCIEGVRPDVSLRAYDEAALVTCDPVERPLTEVARRRPVFALMVFDGSIASITHLMPVRVGTVRLPWGQRYPELDRTLYRLLPNDRVP